MRAWPLAVGLSIVSRTVCSQPADDAVSRLKACFQLERAAQSECLENLSRELAKKDKRDSEIPAAQSWVVSETMSPVDYSPMITATTSSQAVAKDTPAIFMIRCRSHRTDPLVSTQGSWQASQGNQLQVDMRINDQSAVRMKWIASSNGRTAIFKDDAVRFLQSLPDRGRIVVSVGDRQGIVHEGSFQLSGLDVIRQKIAAACKWPPAGDKAAPEER